MSNLLDHQSTTRASIMPQALMRSVGSNDTELMRECGLILGLVVLCRTTPNSCENVDWTARSHEFGAVRPYRTSFSNRAQQEQLSGLKHA